MLRELVAGGRTVVELDFPDAPQGLRRWWLLLNRDEIDVCDDDPGFETDVYVRSQLRTFIRVWGGDLEWADALVPDGGMEVHGSRQLCRQLPSWFTLDSPAERSAVRSAQYRHRSRAPQTRSGTGTASAIGS